MNRKKEIQEELRESAPFLADLDKKEGFSVPKDYFSQLTEQIMEEVSPQAAPAPAPQKSWWEDLLASVQVLFQPRYAIGLASIAVLLTAGFFVLDRSDDAGALATNDDPLQDYILEHIDEFDAEMIWELESTADNDPVEIQESGEDIYLDEILDSIDDEDLEDFL